MSVPNTENIAPNENAQKSMRKKCRLPKALGIYLVAFSLVFVVCSLYAVFQLTNSRSITITINSAAISKGQNPDGSAFDIYQILSDDVLEAAAEQLGGRISTQELKLHLSISDAMQAKANQQLKQSIQDGENENTYFPTVYSLTYSKMSDKGDKNGVASVIQSLVSPGADRILETVAACYQEYYEASYLTYDAMFKIDWESIDALDYYNRAEALRVEGMRVLRFLQDKSDKEPTAISSSNLTYRDLANDLWKLISLDIENHQAYIIQNNLTASRKTLLRQFRYMEEIYKEEKERKTEEYLILSDAVDMYDSTTTKVVFIPALDQDNSFYMNRTKVGLDYLVESADNARLTANEAEHNAQYYQYLQSCFADAVSPKKSQTAHADAIYENIKLQIEQISESVKLLLEENNEVRNEGIKVGSAGMSVGIVGVAMSFAKRFVILSMAAYVFICIPTFFSKKKRADDEEV